MAVASGVQANPNVGNYLVSYLAAMSTKAATELLKDPDLDRLFLRRPCGTKERLMPCPDPADADDRACDGSVRKMVHC